MVAYARQEKWYKNILCLLSALSVITSGAFAGYTVYLLVYLTKGRLFVKSIAVIVLLMLGSVAIIMTLTLPWVFRDLFEDVVGLFRFLTTGRRRPRRDVSLSWYERSIVVQLCRSRRREQESVEGYGMS